VSANRPASAKFGVEAIDKALKFWHGVGDRVIPDRQGKMIDSRFAAKIGFCLKSKNADLLVLEERDEDLNTLGAERLQGRSKHIAAGGTWNDGQAGRVPARGEGQAEGIDPIWLDTVFAFGNGVVWGFGRTRHRRISLEGL